MRHRPYPKIAVHAPQGTAMPGGAWVALEKIHGANMVVGVSASALRFGKRKAWLEPEAPFFGWQLLRAEITAAARELFRAVGSAELYLYGELFGGGYPHPLVAAVPGASPVQTGVWYAPDVRWAVFDILRVTDPDDDGEFLAHHEVVELAAEVGLLTPPVLRTGSRQEVEQALTRFPTRVPALLELPAIDGNFAEGVVVKPQAACAPAARPARKRKITEFDEQRFDESAPFDPTQRLVADDLVVLAAKMVNAPRIASARSKVGDRDADIIDEIVLDVLIDLGEAFPTALQHLRPEDERRLTDEIRQLSMRELAWIRHP